MIFSSICLAGSVGLSPSLHLSPFSVTHPLSSCGVSHSFLPLPHLIIFVLLPNYISFLFCPPSIFLNSPELKAVVCNLSGQQQLSLQLLRSCYGAGQTTFYLSSTHITLWKFWVKLCSTGQKYKK